MDLINTTISDKKYFRINPNECNVQCSIAVTHLVLDEQRVLFRYRLCGDSNRQPLAQQLTD